MIYAFITVRINQGVPVINAGNCTLLRSGFIWWYFYSKSLLPSFRLRVIPAAETHPAFITIISLTNRHSSANRRTGNSFLSWKLSFLSPELNPPILKELNVAVPGSHRLVGADSQGYGEVWFVVSIWKPHRDLCLVMSLDAKRSGYQA